MPSFADKDDGISNPDRVFVERIEDDGLGGPWIQIIWHGDDYRDAWIFTKQKFAVDLDENR